MFIINCKNYDEIADRRSIIRLVKTAQRISKKYKIKIAVAPPQHLLASVAHASLLSSSSSSSIPVLAQHLDNAKVGSTTGFTIPELAKKSKVRGALINHSEHRLPSKDILELVLRLKKLKMTSVVCVKNVSEAAKYAKLNPDYIAIEPPELIGSGKAVSRERPVLITRSVSAVKNAKNKTRLLCGAGIVSGKDIQRAIELGSQGILVASGIIKAKNWNKTIEEFARAMLFEGQK